MHKRLALIITVITIIIICISVLRVIQSKDVIGTYLYCESNNNIDEIYTNGKVMNYSEYIKYFNNFEVQTFLEGGLGNSVMRNEHYIKTNNNYIIISNIHKENKSIIPINYNVDNSTKTIYINVKYTQENSYYNHFMIVIPVDKKYSTEYKVSIQEGTQDDSNKLIKVNSKIKYVTDSNVGDEEEYSYQTTNDWGN